MLEGFKEWWRKATASPAGTGRIGFVRYSVIYYRVPWSKGVPIHGIAKAVELERLGHKSKMMVLDGPAAGTTGWVDAEDDVEWLNDNIDREQ